MTNEEALKILPDMKGAGEDWDKAIDLAIEALKRQESSQQAAVGSQGLTNDAVSRQGAIDAIEKAKTAKAPDGEMYVAKINAEMNIQLLPSVQPDIIRCADCKHRPVANENYDDDEWDCGFNIEFPDHKCPYQCDDPWYNSLPDDNWFCGNAERRTDD